MLNLASGTIKYAYSGNNSLKQVIDQRNLATNYTLNGFGETTVLASPDTGSTRNTYDLAGNVLARTPTVSARRSSCQGASE